MYEIISVFCGLAMVASTLVNDIGIDTLSDNDFVQIETFEDYGGDIVPYVGDLYIEDNFPNDVVEEIIVNQTVVDNSEVLERMDKLDSKLTLLNNSFNSVLSTSNSSLAVLSPTQTLSAYSSFYSNSFELTSNPSYRTLVYDVSDYDYCIIDPQLNKYSSVEVWSYFNMPILVLGDNSLPDKRVTFSNFASGAFVDTSQYNYIVVSYNFSNYPDFIVSVPNFSGGDTPDTPPSDTSGNEPSQPSINVTYPQEVIDNVNFMQKQLVSLTGVTLLNLIIPMFVSVFKRMVDPFKKRRDD